MRYISDSNPSSSSPISACNDGVETVEEKLERVSQLSNCINLSKSRSDLTMSVFPSPAWKSTRVILTHGDFVRISQKESFLTQTTLDWDVLV